MFILRYKLALSGYAPGKPLIKALDKQISQAIKRPAVRKRRKRGSCPRIGRLMQENGRNGSRDFHSQAEEAVNG
jgi:hypothetical protein